MQGMPLRFFLSLAGALLFAMPGASQQMARPDPADPAHPFGTPAAVAAPADDAQFVMWRDQIKAALFMPKSMPPVSPHDFGSFQPMPGVVAHRVTYGTQLGMRVPAIVYSPEHARGKLPAVVVVAGHGGDKTTWYEV